MTPEFTASVQAWAAIASLVVTVFLAGFTFVYVRLTKRMADQMAMQAQPLLIGRVEPLYYLYAKFVISNVGLGPALDVESALTLSTGKSSIWRHALFEPGRSEVFLVPNPDGTGSERDALKDLAERAAVLTSVLRYNDRGGRAYDRTIKVSFKELLDNWDDCQWQLPKSEADKLGEVVTKAVGDLTNKVAEIPKALST